MDHRHPDLHHRAQPLRGISVIVESFTISILTAVLFKILLDLVIGFEERVHTYFAAKTVPTYRVLGPASIFAILFTGKLLVLQAVDLALGDAIVRGSLPEEVVRILSLMITRELSTDSISHWDRPKPTSR